MSATDLVALISRALVALGALAGATIAAVNEVLDAQGLVAIYTAVVALYGQAAIRSANGHSSSSSSGGR